MLQGKRGIVLGVANRRSLAWAIAKAAAERGAEIALTCQGPRFEDATRGLAEQLPDGSCSHVLQVDVNDPATIDGAVETLRDAWGKVDFLVHSIAFANPDELRGRFRDTTPAGFSEALSISAYSLVPLSKAFSELMTDGGSIVALSYLGGERVVPNYNVMGVAKAALDATVRYLAHDLGPQGIRVNSVAPGPIKTVSAAAIGDFGKMLDHTKNTAPLRRNVTADEVGRVVSFLLSDDATAVTGALLPVDCGYSIMGVARGVANGESST